MTEALKDLMNTLRREYSCYCIRFLNACDKECNKCEHGVFCNHTDEVDKAYHDALLALESKSEAEEYRTPKKVVVKHIKETNCDIQYCPTCHVELGEFWPKFEEVPSFCTYCGQALDWSEVE